MEVLIIILINVLLWRYVWRWLEEINLKGNLFGYDVYKLGTGEKGKVWIAECMGLGLMFSLILFYGMMYWLVDSVS